MDSKNSTKSDKEGSDSVKEAVAKRNKLFADAMARKDAAGVADCYTLDAEFI